MKIFLSYHSQERAVIERVNFALLALGHDVFFDQSDLRAGLEYDQAIARAIASSDLFVFFITPGALEPGRYTLTELRLAERQWPHPSGRVLPVMLRPTAIDVVPSYLRAVNIFFPRGELVADTAHEVQRLTGDLRLTSVVGRRVRSRVGLAGVALATILGAFLWVARPWQRSPNAHDPQRRAAFAPLPDDIRHRARAVAALADSGFVVATTAPSELVRFSSASDRIGTPIVLMGEPVLATRTATQVMIVTRARDGVTVLDANDLRLIDTVSLDRSLIRDPPGIADPPRWSGDIESAAVVKGLWATTGDRDGDPTVLRYRQPERRWEVATWVLKPEGFGLDARGLQLRHINGELWGVTTQTTPSSLYHLVNPLRVDEFGGHELRFVSCAQDLAESQTGNLLLLSCENELQEVAVEGKELRLVSTRPTLPTEDGPTNWTDEIIAPIGSVVIVALNTESQQPNNRPAHARIAEVGSLGVVKTLLDVKDAVVRSMAVTARSVVVVLLRSDGTSDAMVVPRSP